MGTGVLGANMKDALDLFVGGMSDPNNWSDTDRLNAKKAEGNEIEDWIDAGKIIELNQTGLTLSADHQNATIFWTTGGSNRTIDATNITGATYKGYRLKIIKVDTGAGYGIFSAKSGEYIQNGKYYFSTIEMWFINQVTDLIYDGSKWWKLNEQWFPLENIASGYLYTNSAPSASTWYAVDVSSYVPNGTISIFAMTYVLDASSLIYNTHNNSESFEVSLWTSGYNSRNMDRHIAFLNASGITYYGVGTYTASDFQIGYPVMVLI